MINLSRALKSDTLLKALTGMSVREFTNLCFIFGPCFENWESNRRDNRVRGVGGGANWALENHMEKLFFLLFYLKMYPTFEVAAFFFEVHKSQTNRWVHNWMKILETALGEKVEMPKRQIRSVEELLEKLPEIKDLLIDGTERPIRRPKNSKKQTAHYSGKKKRHTNNNIVMTDSKRRIIYLGETRPGSEHDYELLKKSGLIDGIPKDRNIYVDMGFQGIRTRYPKHERIIIPTKKPKKKELSDTQKSQNRVVSQARIRVEHAIGGIKRLNCLSDTYRNRKENFEDQIMLIGTALWNYHLAS